MSVKEKIEELRRRLPSGVTLVAVSKTHPVEKIMEAYEAGQRIFAENRPQELCSKYEALPKDIEWHFIGNLQTNKVKYIAPFVSLIQSGDSARLLEFINKEAAKNDRIIDVLLEIHIAREQTKQGWSMSGLEEYLDTGAYIGLCNIRLRGVMGMATYSDNTSLIEKEFTTLRNCFDRLKQRYFAAEPAFDVISMGMTGDYEIAVAAGSNMVRIGSLIFGER